MARITLTKLDSRTKFLDGFQKCLHFKQTQHLEYLSRRFLFEIDLVIIDMDRFSNLINSRKGSVYNSCY